MTFFKCEKCNEVFISSNDSNNMECCGSKIDPLLINNNEEELKEHIPVIRKIGDFLFVTKHSEHPMNDIHHLDFIAIKTNQGFHYKKFFKNNSLSQNFILSENEIVEDIYVKCNLDDLFIIKS